MHFVQPLSVKAAAPRAATAVVATPHFGPSHIPRAAKDDDAIAEAQLASAAEAFMPEVWPDFSKMKVDPDSVVKFFNRKKGYEMIRGHLKRQPTLSLLLLGPKNSGKSELIKILKEKEGPRMLHIDLRMHDTSSPALMAQQLHKQARKLPNVLGMQCLRALASQLGPVSKLYALFNSKFDNTAILEAAVPGEQLVDAFMADVFPPYTATNLTAIIDAYNTTLDNLPPGQRKPVIVIDEANALQLWKVEDSVALKQFLEFLKASCKQYHTAHVILASSEFFMLSWLDSQGYDETVRDDQVLGDLTSAEAFLYLCGGKVLHKEGVEEDWPGLITQSKETLDLGMTREDWKKVWSVCGGNIHLLKVCVGYAEECNSWEQGVAKILSRPQKAVTKALKRPELIRPPVGSDGPRIWEAKHYRAVLRLIAANPYHAVRQEDAEAALQDVGGIPKSVTAAKVLESMVEFNVVSLRSYSEMAEDIPREAFFKEEWGVEEQDNVVTMPSPAHLAAVLLLETKFQKQDEAEGKRASAAEGNNRAYEFNIKAKDALESPSDPLSEEVYMRLQTLDPFLFTVDEVPKFTCTAATLILNAVVVGCTGQETRNEKAVYSKLLTTIESNFDLPVGFLDGEQGLIKAIKKRFVELNDHFQFKDSPLFSIRASKRRLNLVEGQGQVLNGSAAPANQDLGPRPLQSPIRLQDTINPSTAAIREYRAQTQSTRFTLADLYNSGGTDIPSVFPNFEQVINQIQNQPDVMKELVLALKHQLHVAANEKNLLSAMKSKMEQQAPIYFSAVENVIRSHKIAREYLEGILAMDGGIDIPMITAPELNSPLSTEEAVEEAHQEPSLPVEAVTASGQKSHIDRVRGKGYLGDEIELSRLHVLEDDLLDFENSFTTERKMAPGMYFFRNEFFTLCGKHFTDDDKS
ncbi:hypothetical protein KSW81_004363 [Nannochloris sp. 'desiccata']|nr:hypothetical protein KSW81_004363 [Chlorella desiccata (nom. nud.)]